MTLLTAAAAAVTAGLCCVGPLLYLLFGISAAHSPDVAVLRATVTRFLATLLLSKTVVFRMAVPEASARPLLVCVGADPARVVLPYDRGLVL